MSLVTCDQTYAPYSNPAMIDGTGRNPIEERSGAKTFMLDDHIQTNLRTNASAPSTPSQKFSALKWQHEIST